MPRGYHRNRKPQPIGVRNSSVPGVQPGPPPELNPDEAKEWNRLWAVSPPDWFPRETWPLLVQLCRHICMSRWLGETLQEVRQGLLDPKNVKQIAHINSISVMHEREGRAMTALMEKLRLTTQQRLARDTGAALQALSPSEQLPEVTPWATHQ